MGTASQLTFDHLVLFGQRFAEICAHCGESVASDGTKSCPELPAHQTVERKIECAGGECEQIHQLAQSRVAACKEIVAQEHSEQAEDSLR